MAQNENQINIEIENEIKIDLAKYEKDEDIVECAEEGDCAHMLTLLTGAPYSLDNAMSVRVAKRLIKKFKKVEDQSKEKKKKKKSIYLSISHGFTSEESPINQCIEYDEGCDATFIIESLRKFLPIFANCHLFSNDGARIASVEEFENLDANSSCDNPICLHARNVDASDDLRYLYDILPVVKKSGTEKNDYREWSYENSSQMKIALCHGIVSIIVFSIENWAFYCWLFSMHSIWIVFYGLYYNRSWTMREWVYIIISMASLASMVVLFWWQKFDALKWQPISCSLCFGMWDKYGSKTTHNSQIVKEFCRMDGLIAVPAHCGYAALTYFSLSGHEWDCTRVILYIALYLCVYLSHGSWFMVFRMRYHLKRKGNQWQPKFVVTHLTLLYIMVIVFGYWVENELNKPAFGWIVNLSGSLLVLIVSGILYCSCKSIK